MNAPDESDHMSHFDGDIRDVIRRAAASVDVPDMPAPPVRSVRRMRRRASATRRALAVATVVLIAAVAAIVRSGNAPTRVDSIAPAGESRDRSPSTSTTTPETSTTTSTTSSTPTSVAPRSGPEAREARLRAFRELDLPPLSLHTRAADFSNPFVGPPVDFELGPDWQGSTEFVDAGGGSGGMLGFAAAPGEPADRFVVLTAGSYERPTDLRIPARDGSTWAVRTVAAEPGPGADLVGRSDLVVAIGEPLDGSLVVVFGGLQRSEWEHALRSTSTAVGLGTAGLPDDLVDSWHSFRGSSSQRYFLNARGPDFLFLRVELSYDTQPLWADAVAARARAALDEDATPPDRAVRCDSSGDVEVCAALETDVSNAEIVLRLSAWQAGLRVDATLPLRASAASAVAAELDETAALLSAAIDAIRIPVR